jgi:hypothetical protein
VSSWVKGFCHFFHTLFRTSGQNSANAFPDILPTTPNTQRSNAFPAAFSLGSRHVFDRKLLPAFPMYRA